MPRRPRPADAPTLERWLLAALLPAPLPAAMPDLSRAELHALARSLHATLLDDDPRLTGIARNHTRRLLALRGHRPRRVLLLAHAGTFLAFAAADDPDAALAMTHDFLDVPGAAELLPDRTVLPRALLERPFDPRAPRLRAELAAADVRDLEFWTPRRVGDVLFNSWD